MGQPLPRVANVDFSRLKIEVGDRVIIRYWCDLDREQLKKLRAAFLGGPARRCGSCSWTCGKWTWKWKERR